MAGLFSRNLVRCGRSIDVENRTTKFINGQPTLIFTAFLSSINAIIKTVRGVSVFDDTNTARVATHEICLAYFPGVTAEMWVKLGTRRIKILTVENCCEKNEVLRLMCTERGEDSQVVNQA